MNWRALPVLLLGAVLCLAGGFKLLGTDSTSPAAAGCLLGAGVVILGLWVGSEIRERKDAVQDPPPGPEVEDHPDE